MTHSPTSNEQVAMAVAVLRDAYPRQDFPDASVSLYARMLADLDGAAVADAVKRLIRRSTFLPSIAEIRSEAAEAACGLPTGAEAWSMVVGDYPRDELPDPVRQSLDAMGGRWSVVHSERPETLRAQFLRDYHERRSITILRASGAAAVPALAPPSASSELAALPETEAIRPRPVWLRWLRRQGIFEDDGARLDSPTDDEMHDAILVLRDTGQGRPTVMAGDPLHVEAQRILDEASAS